MKRVGCAGRANGRCGFTLVELVTSASLMTVMMLGVVQVFGIVTQTASEAEGIHFAEQQLRALFNRLHNDLRGMTREGYLRVAALPNQTDYRQTGAYNRDTLAFVTIGRCASIFANQPYEGTAAEVVYTNNVQTPNAVLAVDPGGGAAMQVDARRGILGRGQWIMSGQPPGTAHDFQDTSASSYLCNLFEAQQRNRGTAGNRVADVGAYLRVDPWTATGGLPSQHPETLKRVMASCVSEFYVETFDPNAGSAGGPPVPGGGATAYFRNLSGTYTWSRRLRTDPIKTWPPALRVTVAVHDPSDTSQPEQYVGGASAGRIKPFRGFVLQEVFWLTDP